MPLPLLGPLQLDPAQRRLRRHRFYRHLLLLNLFILGCFSLPAPLNRLGHFGYTLTLLALIVQLQESLRPGGRRSDDRPFRLAGLACLVSMLFWSFTPVEMRNSGLPLLLLVTVFIAWCLKRLIAYLSEEKLINQEVLVGAVAGYLLMGLTAGLMVTVLETVSPGSFLGAGDQGALSTPRQEPEWGMVWDIDFVRLNYYAFVCLSTLGFGDILPQTGAAQMLTVLFTVVGPVYMAVVMGILISRLTVQGNELIQTRQHQEPQPGQPPAGESPAGEPPA
ncbi:MAG: potassium channel family protein [Synechococcus sp.]